MFKTTIAFQEQRINSLRYSEEDWKQSEKKLLQLQETLRNTIKEIKAKGKAHNCLNAHVEVNTAAVLT